MEFVIGFILGFVVAFFRTQIWTFIKSVYDKNKVE